MHTNAEMTNVVKSIYQNQKRLPKALNVPAQTTQTLIDTMGRLRYTVKVRISSG